MDLRGGLTWRWVTLGHLGIPQPQPRGGWAQTREALPTQAVTVDLRGFFPNVEPLAALGGTGYFGFGYDSGHVTWSVLRGSRWVVLHRECAAGHCGSLYGITVPGAFHKHPGDADEGGPHFEKLIQKEPSAGQYLGPLFGNLRAKPNT